MNAYARHWHMTCLAMITATELCACFSNGAQGMGDDDDERTPGHMQESLHWNTEELGTRFEPPMFI